MGQNRSLISCMRTYSTSTDQAGDVLIGAGRALGRCGGGLKLISRLCCFAFGWMLLLLLLLLSVFKISIQGRFARYSRCGLLVVGLGKKESE